MASLSRQGPDDPGLVAWLWVDAQLPPAMALWFWTDLRIEAVHVADLDLLDAKDRDIFQSARTSDRAVVVVTKDDDFRQLIVRHGPPPQVIWVRCGNVTNPELSTHVSPRRDPSRSSRASRQFAAPPPPENPSAVADPHPS